MTAVLTPEQIEQINTEGYFTPVRIMDAAEAGTLRAKLEATEAARGGKLAPTERSKAHMLFKWLDDLIRDPRVLDPIEQLIGPNILCWNTLFWIKEAQSPSFVSWHQDTKYWGLSSEKVITAWLALSPASLDAGCMRVMPRTHIGDVLPHDDQYHQDNLLTRGQQITEGVDDAEAIYMPLQVGEMSLHNYRLAHASGPNNTDDRRIGVSMHFMPTETGQIVGNWDSAALVRGEDTFGNFTHTPIPAADFDEEAVAFHAKAAQAINEIVYAGADENTAKL
ncbi:MAG: phytanoyl-CoA dioxygenase family protein [Pseudomonadota bacterium]|nr:phytanoyl-CoA dioxygenase family protein [Pseudomonadota bacterium]